MEKRLEAALKRDSVRGGEQGISKREAGKGDRTLKVKMWIVAIKVGGQLCNVKAVKLNEQVDKGLAIQTESWLHTFV